MDYIKRNIKSSFEMIKLRIFSLKEYKTTFYMSLCLQVFFAIAMLTFYSVFYINFIDDISWTLSEYLIFIGITNVSHLMLGFVFWKKRLFNIITSGELNIYLTKPLNPFIYFYSFTFSTMVLIFFIGDSLFLAFIIYYIKNDITNIISSLFIFMLILIETLILAMFIDSLEFVKKNISSFLFPIFDKTSQITRNYPGVIFSDFSFAFLLYIMHGFFTSLILVPVITGSSITNYIYEIFLLLLIITILGVGTWLNWHYGLKRYEAYG